ncbi:hypothetical protein ACSBR2_020570 [Camellia fascicularis]
MAHLVSLGFSSDLVSLDVAVNPSHENFHTDATNIINIPELVNQVKDEEFDSPSHVSEKEKFGSVTESKDIIVPANDHHDIPIVSESGSTSACTVSLPVTQLLTEPETCDFHPILKIDNEEFPTLLDFEEKCPPGGSEVVILYTTSLRGIRKTFEDCCSIRFLLESFRVLYHERDVSMHLEFREELWRIAGGRVVPPRLFIKGRHIGGADEVVGLHEQGRLRNLLRGIPPKPYNGPCNGCGGDLSRRILQHLQCLELPRTSYLQSLANHRANENWPHNMVGYLLLLRPYLQESLTGMTKS